VRFRQPLARVLLASALLSAASACSAFPDAAATGQRLKVDGFVLLTSPIGVPWVAATESWGACSGDEGHTKLLLPVFFVGYTLAHTGLAVLHTLDLVAAPIHLVAGNGPAAIYRGCELPLVREKPLVSSATGELALYGVAGTGGALIAYWFVAIYIPEAFSFWTGAHTIFTNR
jgi:hypothetical protein